MGSLVLDEVMDFVERLPDRPVSTDPDPPAIAKLAGDWYDGLAFSVTLEPALGAVPAVRRRGARRSRPR